ncbi:hypothetical protein C9927_04480 [Pseudidiomarina aestuarii]|uniref:Uncharacterized protein n=1 Tax=Pseudidiomarina aestuarii TaxID=624146 RepID=A0A2T4D3H4_9GAMM|nr:hypothetical protein C9927_04480 [Pseudidiomarina aestuarii]PTB88839.1 hypothetical protein C9928_05410 [Pseudidiomarina aestuarii]
MKTIGKLTTALSIMVVSNLTYAGACDEMEAELSAISGAVPKFTENGELHSISMYADASFIAPKRSLISSARDEAELKAKSELTKFFEESLGQDTLVGTLSEQVEKTDFKGNSEAVAIEVRRVANIITSSSEAVVSGIVKLDECVDTDGKFLIVRMGWKPNYSELAQDAKDTERDKSKIKEAKSYRKKSELADDF